MTNIITDSTCGRRQRVPGRRCSTDLTPPPPPGTPHNSQRAGTGTIPVVQIRKLRQGEAPSYTALGPMASAAGHQRHQPSSQRMLGCQAVGGHMPAHLPLTSWAQSSEKQAPGTARTTGRQRNTLSTTTIHFYPQDTCDTKYVAFPHHPPDTRHDRVSDTWIQF